MGNYAMETSTVTSPRKSVSSRRRRSEIAEHSRRSSESRGSGGRGPDGDILLNTDLRGEYVRQQNI
jgi:hypothetical protein